MNTAAREEGFVDVPGGRVFYRSFGEGGVPLLCLHGGPGFTMECVDAFGDLADRRQVVFYDQLGCGRSTAPNDPALWVVERFVEELVAVREHLRLEPMHLWGGSWGGMLGMQYIVNRQPDLVSFVNSSGPASIPMWIEEMHRLLKELPEPVRAEIERHEAEGWYACPEYIAAVLEYDKRHVCRMDPWPPRLERAYLGVNTEQYTYMAGPSEFAVTGTLKDWNITDRLAEIRVPTLLTSGRYDECTPAQMEHMHKRIPGSRLVIFEESSHLHYYEERARYMQVMNDWFDETEAAWPPSGPQYSGATI
jgi:proline-specific peptidase